ncbi:MAG: HK97 family phage prohead protease [Prevotellaceae bacterium]|nr:HK97 family phage prohead protease [Prevotellaceae bacterium]
MKETLREIFTQSGLQIREAQGENEVKAKEISGYAIRFNEDSVKMYGYMTERIAPTCVTEEVLRESDIKMTLFHNREKLLARSNKGKGTLRLSVDEKGAKFAFDVPDTELGREVEINVANGNYSGCSFTFVPGDYDIQDRGTDDVLVTHTRFNALLEMTIGTDPAYPTTSVDCREFAESVKGEVARQVEESRKEAQAKADAAERMRREAAMMEIDNVIRYND